MIDDARSYIENSHDQFDLIVFSLLDSHTTTSHFTNIRIDNYVYTREALQRARRLLKPDGLFIVKFQVDNPWIAGRLFQPDARCLRSRSDSVPERSWRLTILPADSSSRGSRERLAQATSDPALAAYLASHSENADAGSHA